MRIGFRFSLLSLLIIMLLAGALGPFGWVKWKAWKKEQERQAMERQRQERYEAGLASLRAIHKAQQELRVGFVRDPKVQERIRRILESEDVTQPVVDNPPVDCPNSASPKP